MHAPPQSARLDAHASWHAPLLHTCPDAQGCPQAPQWFGSLRVFTHEPEQSVSPVAHVHEPATQWDPPVQRRPHAPQFPSSAPSATHAPLHAV